MESEGDAIQWTRELLETGEDPNNVNLEYQFSPLELAWSEGRLELMKILIASGANTGIPFRWETIEWFCDSPLECTLLMFEHEYSLESCYSIHEFPDDPPEKICGLFNPLYELASNGELAIIDALRPYGIMELLSVYDELGHAPLQSAANDNNLDLVRWMLAQGADINAHSLSRIGSTALDIAVHESNLEIVKTLIHAGANPNIPTHMWITATDQACKISDAPRKPGREDKHRVELTQIKSLVLEAAKRFPPPVYPNGRIVETWPPKP